jgi:hypothetical protein
MDEVKAIIENGMDELVVEQEQKALRLMWNDITTFAACAMTLEEG